MIYQEYKVSKEFSLTGTDGRLYWYKKGERWYIDPNDEDPGNIDIINKNSIKDVQSCVNTRDIINKHRDKE